MSKNKKKITISTDEKSGRMEEAIEAAAKSEEAKESDNTGKKAKSDLSQITIDILTKEVEKYKKEAADNLTHFQYSRAELDNLKKRVIQDRNDMRKFGIVDFTKAIINVVDNLDRALEHLENADKESLTQGIKMTLSEFNKTLEQFGITQVKAVGEQFDPNVHEGIMMVDSDEHAPNSVIEEFQKGYILDDRLIRPAKVSVNLKKDANEGAAENMQETMEADEDIDVVEVEVVED